MNGSMAVFVAAGNDGRLATSAEQIGRPPQPKLHRARVGGVAGQRPDHAIIDKSPNLDFNAYPGLARWSATVKSSTDHSCIKNMKLTLENVRGFVGKHSLTVKPVTILVGENSSGKTTLLSALSSALQPDFPTADGFNRAPFELGSFDTIATYRGGKYGRALTFSIGWEGVPSGSYFIRATFHSHHGIPRVRSVEVSKGSARLSGDANTGEWTVTTDSANTIKFRSDTADAKAFSLSDLPRMYLNELRPRKSGVVARDEAVSKAVDVLFDLSMNSGRDRPRVTALAPLRTRPHRTYDELIEEFKPEGDHIPLVLARILSADGASDKATTSALNAFGKSSGLFSTLKVKRMGRQPSDPFQLRVKSRGPDANLVDVGYGVSQALPIVVDSILAPRGRIVLVQQPEVHLHPKAQAALGTFFCEITKGTGKHFVIETHSDYLVDRG